MIRGTLAGSAFSLSGDPFLLISAWCVASFAVTYKVMNRRA